MTRNLTISYLRVTAMLMVVFFHCLCVYTPAWGNQDPNVVYTSIATFMNYIDMPLFVFISGVLYGQGVAKGRYNDSKAFVVNKSKRLLLPFAVWGLFSFLFLDYKLKSLYTGIGHLWFLIMLFGVFIVFHFTRRYWMKLNERNSLFLMLLLVLISIASWKLLIYIQLFLVQRVLYYMFAFYLGANVNKCKIGGGKLYISLSIITLAICSIYGIPPAVGKVLFPVAASILCISLYITLGRVKLKERTWLLQLDKYSMGIYLTHHIIITILIQQPELKKYILNNLWTPVVIFPMLLLVSYYITKIGHCIRIGKYAGL